MVEHDADELHLGFTACGMESNIASIRCGLSE